MGFNMFDLKKLNKDNRGVFGYAYAFLIAVVLCIIMFGIISIVVSNFASVTMVALQPLQTQTLANAGQVTDSNISQSMIAAVNGTIALQQTNVEMFQLLAGMVGILTIVIVAIVFFLLTQKNVQANAGMGGIQ